MWDIVEGIHKALKIESTWAFVLVVALGSALVGGFLAWIIDTGYRNSPEYKAEYSPKQQTVTTTASNSASQSVTVQTLPAQGMAQQTKSQRREKTATIATSKPQKPKPVPGKMSPEQNRINAVPQTCAFALGDASYVAIVDSWIAGFPQSDKCNSDSTTKSANPGAYKFVGNTVVGGGIPLPKNVTDAEIRLNNLYGTNSAFQNGGKADKIYMEDNVIHPAPGPGGTATVIQNLPGAEISDVTARRNTVLGADWWGQFADQVVASSGDKQKIQELGTHVRNQCEVMWRLYSPEQQQKYRDELNAILQKVIDHFDDEKVISDELHRVPEFAKRP
jgi:hypothetical protein